MQQLRWKIAQFFENFWWKNYLKSKSPKDYLIWKTNYWNQFLIDIDVKKISLETPMIDIGCGPAGIFSVLDNKITALDPLLDEYQKLEIFKQEVYPSVKFVQSSFENFESILKYKSIFCLNAINHFINIDLSFKKLNQICATNGQLILSIDAHNHTFFRKLFALIPFDILHPHQYNLKEYEIFLTQNGFEIEKSKLMKKDFFFSYWVLVARKK